MCWVISSDDRQIAVGQDDTLLGSFEGWTTSQDTSIPQFKHLLERGAIYFPLQSQKSKSKATSYPLAPHFPPMSMAHRASRIASDLFITKLELEAISATLVLATACILFFVSQKPPDARYPILSSTQKPFAIRMESHEYVRKTELHP